MENTKIEKQSLTAEECYNGLTWHINNDEEYAWTFHCNLAVGVLDATGISIGASNFTAAHLMRQLYDIDMNKNIIYINWLKCHESANTNGVL